MKARCGPGARISLILFCSFVLFGVAGVGVEDTAYAQHWWEPLPTPSPEPTPEPTATPEGPPCTLAVLETEPAEAFDVIGVVEVGASVDAGPETTLEVAKSQACRLGGDAIVIVYRNTRYRTARPSVPARGGVLSDPALRAAVIRYRQR